MVSWLLATILAPITGSVLIGISHRSLKNQIACFIACFAMCISAFCGTKVWINSLSDPSIHNFFIAPWIHTQNLHLDWSLCLDPLSALFCFFITVISLMVHIYATGYMHGDESIKRFMAYLNLFTFCMLLLVTAGNYVQMFVGWEGVGVASYLLVGFWYQKSAARSAAIKAFFVNRVADSGLIFALCAAGTLIGSLEMHKMVDPLPYLGTIDVPFFGESYWVTIIGIAFLIGAMGKSAQMGLHIWLPDAMEGPTPVSALIHAATMVTAGIFLMARLSPLIHVSCVLAATITILGALTAFFAGCIGAFQFDIKRSIAYSTCSQLGYMMAAIGALAPHAAIFHLTTHAFFKALLFLSAGSVIHACSNNQDMRQMGGLRKLIPKTFALMALGSVALCGIPPFSGFFSKEAILESLWGIKCSYGQYAFWLCLIGASLTAFYTTRMLFMTFFGPKRMDDATKHHIHESPAVMWLPMAFLGLATLCSSLFPKFFISYRGMYVFSETFHIQLHHGHIPILITLLSFIFIGLAIFISYSLYATINVKDESFEKKYPRFFKFWRNRGYVDELYWAIFVRPYLLVSYFIGEKFDLGIMDKYLIESFAVNVNRAGQALQKIYKGSIPIMLLMMLIGWITMIVYGLNKGGFL